MLGTLFLRLLATLIELKNFFQQTQEHRNKVMGPGTDVLLQGPLKSIKFLQTQTSL